MTFWDYLCILSPNVRFNIISVEHALFHHRNLLKVVFRMDQFLCSRKKWMWALVCVCVLEHSQESTFQKCRWSQPTSIYLICLAAVGCNCTNNYVPTHLLTHFPTEGCLHLRQSQFNKQNCVHKQGRIRNPYMVSHQQADLQLLPGKQDPCLCNDHLEIEIRYPWMSLLLPPFPELQLLSMTSCRQ